MLDFRSWLEVFPEDIQLPFRKGNVVYVLFAQRQAESNLVSHDQ